MYNKFNDINILAGGVVNSISIYKSQYTTFNSCLREFTRELVFMLRQWLRKCCLREYWLRGSGIIELNSE